MTQDCNSNIEKQIREIWRSTFGDTPAYVDLLFDAYFNENLCSWITLDDKVAACGVGIPYEFASGNGAKFKGLYLCGLATIPEMRRRGLMTRLLEQMENNARNHGFDATFLIPADEELRNFYAKRGYKNTSKRILLSLEKSENIREKHHHRDTEEWKLTVLRSDDAAISELAALASQSEILYNEVKSALQYNAADRDYNLTGKIRQNRSITTSLNNVNYKLQNIAKNKLQNNRFNILHNIKDFEIIIKEKLQSESLIIIGRKNNIINFCSILDKDGKVWPIIGDLKLQIKLLYFISNIFSDDNNNIEQFQVDSSLLEDITNFFNKIKNEDGESPESKNCLTLKIVIDDPELLDEFEQTGDGLLKFVSDDDPSCRRSVNLRCELEDFGMIKFLNGENILIRENRIFESDCNVCRKYEKIENGSENEKNLGLDPELVSFRLMLD